MLTMLASSRWQDILATLAQLAVSCDYQHNGSAGSKFDSHRRSGTANPLPLIFCHAVVRKAPAPFWYSLTVALTVISFITQFRQPF